MSDHTHDEWPGAVQKAHTYYESNDADMFYRTVWGNDNDIHLGIFSQPDEPLVNANRRTIEYMARQADNLDNQAYVIDLGSGYGGTARYLASTYGCRVVCLNISALQNERNRERNAEAGLDHAIEVMQGSFEAIPYDPNTFTLAWSQDAFLHASDRPALLREIYRVLRPGGGLIFTDPLRSDDCPPDALGPVLGRVGLDSMASFAEYRAVAEAAGFAHVRTMDLSPNLVTTYARVRETANAMYDTLLKDVSETYLDRMIQGLGYWIEAGKQGHLQWGIQHFRKPA